MIDQFQEYMNRLPIEQQYVGYLSGSKNKRLIFSRKEHFNGFLPNTIRISHIIDENSKTFDIYIDIATVTDSEKKRILYKLFNGWNRTNIIGTYFIRSDKVYLRYRMIYSSKDNFNILRALSMSDFLVDVLANNYVDIMKVLEL